MTKKVRTAVKQAEKAAKNTPDALTIGEMMPEGHSHAGWIYGGISKTTRQPFYIAPKDTKISTWDEATAYGEQGQARLPSDKELRQIYAARARGALKNTFNLTGYWPEGFYWTATTCKEANTYAYDFRFRDGNRMADNKNSRISLRLVRD